MSSIYITEYASLARDAQGNVIAAGQEPAAVEQKKTVSGTSAQSDAFGGTTRFVQISVDGITSLQFGTNPTATTSMQRLAAGEKVFYGVRPDLKVAFITNT